MSQSTSTSMHDQQIRQLGRFTPRPSVVDAVHVANRWRTQVATHMTYRLFNCLSNSMQARPNGQGGDNATQACAPSHYLKIGQIYVH